MKKRWVPGKGAVDHEPRKAPSLRVNPRGRPPIKEAEMTWDAERREWRFHDGIEVRTLPSYGGK